MSASSMLCLAITLLPWIVAVGCVRRHRQRREGPLLRAVIFDNASTLVNSQHEDRRHLPVGDLGLDITPKQQARVTLPRRR